MLSSFCHRVLSKFGFEPFELEWNRTQFTFFPLQFFVMVSIYKPQIGGQRLWNLPAKCNIVNIFVRGTNYYYWWTTIVYYSKIDVLWAELSRFNGVQSPGWKKNGFVVNIQILYNTYSNILGIETTANLLCYNEAFSSTASWNNKLLGFWLIILCCSLTKEYHLLIPICYGFSILYK